METQSPDSISPAQQSNVKQPACLNCRRSKIRCNRPTGHSRCEKCRQSNVDCVVPSHHLGRQKGVKNKRKGLEKAIHQIEQAIKRPKVDPSSSDEAQKAISGLQELLSQVQNQLKGGFENSATGDSSREGVELSPRETVADESLALDDAENPLQLLARASDLQFSPTEIRQPLKPAVSVSHQSLGPPLDIHDIGHMSAKSFFVPVQAKLDVGPSLDPIDLGLVTFDEADSLFSFFYQNLAHTRWGLDPLVHTTSFVRSQSAFLLTSIMAGTALFLPSAAALSNRLSRHCKWLAKQIVAHRYRSVEIVLAFMVNIPWMAPAMDLSLNKIVAPIVSGVDGDSLKRLSRADCIDAKRALHMDGFSDVDPRSQWGRRLLLRRERAWIALFVVERGVCLARGRTSTIPSTALIENCDCWYLSDLADQRDGPMNSMAVLRRDLDELLKRVKSSCDTYRTNDTGSQTAQAIKTTIESFFERWYTRWSISISENGAQSLPPYVEILVTHTQLSTYGGVINHPTAPVEVKRFFRAAGLSSALNVLRAAIQGEARLKSMPNNTVIMISYAACAALSLSVTPGDSRSSLAPSVRALIEETAGVLERIGATPSHRNGASVLYGRFLREIIRRGPTQSAHPHAKPRPLNPSQPGVATIPLAAPGPSLATSTALSQDVLQTGDLWSEPMHFSAMSDNQIIDAVNRAGSAFGASIPDVPVDDMLSWDWLDYATTDFTF
ncbi:Fungal Zn(2)-Cys(6) binuclear cluster domain-containing protein [Penicillium ucsense]|uniref:Fungal Zn(2)-Cys(6) binuclear cluster domain-containing protein n=1 Tax=Penicillium ucsense TaxID=2839758 RepID=A0A8J8VVX4_9EURO|nr:Fungal Zn(2)-Cys(6) binuclear cluster domain-containing protein [Penicillium ucsense]KAF7729591.1 Fungal Zn(2)-Cys(6) binuclear cluster domain-containing protein [Penicillium ucsense]